MATTLAPITANLDSWIAQVDGVSYGNGSGTKMWLGRFSDTAGIWNQRCLVQFPMATILAAAGSADEIVAATMKLAASNTCFTSFGSTPRFFAERITGSWAENAYAVACSVDPGYAANTEWPGPTVDVANRAYYNGGKPANNAVIDVDVLALVKQAYDLALADLGMRLIACDGTNYDEADPARRIGFHTRHSAGYEPELSVDIKKSGGWVYRGGLWVQAESIQAYRGGTWDEVEVTQVRRGTTWVDAE